VTLDLDEESYMELDVDDVVKEMLSKAKQVSYYDWKLCCRHYLFLQE
jgi:hypothetical protein